MTSVRIYHNPRCSKSRRALELLEERQVEPTVIEYLKTPPTVGELRDLSTKLGMRPAEFLRRGEDVLPSLALDLEDDGAVLAAMAQHPILIERPIVVADERAVVGRPPERVLELLARP